MNDEFIKTLDDYSLYELKKLTVEELKNINQELEKREIESIEELRKLGKGN